MNWIMTILRIKFLEETRCTSQFRLGVRADIVKDPEQVANPGYPPGPKKKVDSPPHAYSEPFMAQGHGRPGTGS